MNNLKKAWKRWKAFGRKVADLQGRILLTIFYFIFISPIGLIFKFFSDPLNIKKPSESSWVEFGLKSDSLEEARRLY